MKQITQQEVLIKRLRRGWLNSLQAVQDCACLKLTTRVNEPDFIAKVLGMGYRIERKEANKTRYVSYRIVKGVAA